MSHSIDNARAGDRLNLIESNQAIAEVKIKIASVVDKPDSVFPPRGEISIIDLGRTLLHRL